MSGGPPAGAPLLAVDAGSPVVSVALAAGDRLLAEETERIDRSSARLLAMIDRVLAAGGVARAELGGVVALRGPGSFTGLRVGLATVLALHQALRLPAAALSTLRVLAELGPGDGSTVVAVVDALRGEWFAQPFRSQSPPRALSPARVVAAAELAALGGERLIGFGASAAAVGESALAAIEPASLAGAAATAAARLERWDPALLIEPLYLRPPSARPAAGGR